MSESSGSRKSLAGWTMVDSKGEVMTDDNRSDSSESSNDVISLPEEVSINTSASEASSAHLLQEHDDGLGFCEQCRKEENNETVMNHSEERISLGINHQPTEISSPSFEPAGDECARQEETNEMTSQNSHFTDGSLVERDGGLGACCVELLEMQSIGKNQHDEESDEMEDKEEIHNSFLSSVPPDANATIPCPSFQDEVDKRAPRERNNSDSDSDFVQIDEHNMEEFEAELERSRNGTPSRSPSIAEGFNFLGPPDGGVMRDEPAGNISEEDDDLDMEDFNEDTESSAEDNGDDRIESDQSDVGSVNALTDVGDLSTFADIGDLPLEVGDVARNYCHRPNNRLSSVLNIVLVVVTILTMGISIGLIMATDQEIEEWHNAYLAKDKKVSSLEWTLQDMDQTLQESKDKVNAYDAVLKSFSKAHKPNDNTVKFLTNFAGIVNNFELCARQRGSLSAVDCHALILPDVLHSLSHFKEVSKTDSVDETSHYFAERNSHQMEDDARTLSREKRSHDHYYQEQLQEIQESLNREQERALHWQNLYLLERRQREWERENEDLEDKRERAQWEKEDEEEDRKERERWEREEAENDRMERLQWEKEEQEEDKRDRERWEKERAEMDGLECLKKLMGTNLTNLRDQIKAWNVSAFDDFVNMSMLRSGIAELKQSVITSVQEIWAEAEETLNKIREDVKNGRQPYLDTSMMADYLKQALAILRSQFDDVVNMENFGEKVKPDSRENRYNHNNNADRKYTKHREDFGESPEKEKTGMWNKAIGKMFKKTSKSLRKFVRTMATSWTTVKEMWGKKASNSIHTGKPEEKVDPLPSWLPGKACRSVFWFEDRDKSNIMVEIGSPCLWDVRDGFSKLILKESCEHSNHYNVKANIVWRFKRDLKGALEADERYRGRKVDLIRSKDMLQLLEKFWRTWGDSEILIKSDKDWAYCQLQYWSNFIAANKDGLPKHYGDGCSRLVNLNLILDEIGKRKILPTECSKIKVENSDEDDLVKENDVLKNQRNLNCRSSSEFNDGDDCDEDDLIEDDDDSEDVDDHGDDEKSLPSIAPLELDSNYVDKKQEGNHSGNVEETSEDEQFKHEIWYLKRAQYRLKMRKAQEKAMWFFDLSDNRGEMRKEHNLEKYSGQWLFDQAEDREAQRKKDRESDWLFDRAQYRREEFAKKWSKDDDGRRERHYRKDKNRKSGFKREYKKSGFKEADNDDNKQRYGKKGGKHQQQRHKEGDKKNGKQFRQVYGKKSSNK